MARGCVTVCILAVSSIACGGAIEAGQDAAATDGAVDVTMPSIDSGVPFDVAVVDAAREAAIEAGEADVRSGADAADAGDSSDATDAGEAGGDAGDSAPDGCPPTYGGAMAGCPSTGLTCDYPQGTCVCTQGCCGIPRTCAQQGIQCGMAGDGCGGVLNCGTCPSPQVCGGGGQPGICGLSEGGCTPMTCAEQPWACGLTGDGCGGVLDCTGNCVWACTSRPASCPAQAPTGGAPCSTPGLACPYPAPSSQGCCTTTYQCTGGAWSAGAPMCPG